MNLLLTSVGAEARPGFLIRSKICRGFMDEIFAGVKYVVSQFEFCGFTFLPL